MKRKITSSQKYFVNGKCDRKFLRTCYFFAGSILWQNDFRIGKTEDIVSWNMIIPAQSDQKTNWHFIGSAFVSGIHGLRSTQIIRNLCLRFIRILPQITNTLPVVQVNPPKAWNKKFVSFYLLYDEKCNFEIHLEYFNIEIHETIENSK